MKNKIESANRRGPVLLISAPVMYTFPFSFAYLAGYLLQKKENVKILFRNVPPEQLVRQIIAEKPLMVGFGSLYPELKEIKEIIALLDEAGRDFPVEIGGQMVSPIPEFALEITGANIGVVGEGEITLFKLTQALREGEDISNIGGIVFHDGDKIISTGEGEYIKDLNDLPPIPFEMFPEEKWLPVGHWYAAFVPRSHWRYDDRVIPVHGGRGCPFKCNFCYHHSRFRQRPIEAIIEETAAALERFDGNFLDISDDLVLNSPARARELIAGLKKLSRPVEYYLSAHFEVIARMSDTELRELRESGCRIIGPGYESGSNRILKLIGKKFTVETILAQTARLKRSGIKAVGNFMIGQHTETLEDVEMTLDLVRETLAIDPDIEYTFSIMTPFPGSALYSLAKEQGLLKDDQQFYDEYFKGGGIFDWRLIANLSAMTDQQVLDGYNRLQREYDAIKDAAFGHRLRRICFLKKAIGQFNYRLDKYIWNRSKYFNICRKISDASCGILMRPLEKRELKIRNKAV